jgi:hypothetical protein
VIRDPPCHRRSARVRDLEALVDPSEVVVHEMADRRRVVLDLLGEDVGQPSEAAHPHPHREVLALDVTGGDPAGIRVAHHGGLLGPDADGGAVARAVGRAIGDAAS